MSDAPNDTTIMRQQGGLNATGRTPMDEWQDSVRERAAEMTADGRTLTRVNAWLASRAEWLDASEQRQQLRAQWRAVTLAFGPESAAACGVLLGLVLTAIGPGAGLRLDIEPVSVFHERVTSARVLDGCLSVGRSDGVSIAKALVSLLEAAP